MKKKDIKVLAIVAVALAIALVIVYLFTSYRGPDGLTFKEAQMLKKYGAAKITKEELEDAIDLDKYNETIDFYDNDPSFGDKVKHFFGSDSTDVNVSDNKGKAPRPKDENNKKEESEDKESGEKENVSVPSGKTSYEKYIAMSPEKQQAYFKSFDSASDFFKWYNSAKAEYDKKNEAIEVEGGSIDIGDYMD